MTLRSRRLCFSAFLVAICFANDLRAQTTTSGGLIGVVTDQSGALVLEAGIALKDNSKGTTQSTKTDREGVYRFFFVAPARYTLTVTHQSFRPESRTVNVFVGPPVTVNVSLTIAKTSNEITVTSEAPLVQAENGDVSVTMDQQQISEVPNPGNDLTYIAQTAPGVIMNTETSGPQNFSSLGMPGTSNLFTVDGMSENDNGLQSSLAGSLNLLLGQNQIQEATVVSIGYSGQFGGAAGAMVNYITKSGGNQFHGNVQYFWNGTALNANDWFNVANGLPRPFDDANQWAGSLGGPIRRDKLFFFFDSEGDRLTLVPTLDASFNSIVLIPSPQFESDTIQHIDKLFGSASASDAFYKKIFALYNGAPGARSAVQGGINGDGCLGFADPDDPNGFGHNGVPCALHFYATPSGPFRDTLTMARVDWTAGSSDRVFLRLQNEFGYSTDFVDPINSLFNADGHQVWWQSQINETHSFGSSAASQFLLAGYYLRPIFTVQNPSAALAAMPTDLNFSQTTSQFNNLGGFNGLAADPAGRPTTQFQFSEDLAKTWRGHKFGIGASFERIYWTTLFYPEPLLIGTLIPQTVDAFYQGGVDRASPETDFTQLQQSFAIRTRARMAFYSLGLYEQDEWRARPNLSLTLALRAEHRSNPTCRDRCFARLAGPFGSLDQDPAQPYNQGILTKGQAFAATDELLWSPRFSFAWQPLGVSHNWVLRGGVGIFYDPVSGNHGIILANNPPLINSYSLQKDNLSPGEKTNLFSDAAMSNMAFTNNFNSGAPPTQLDNLAGFAPPAITTPQPHMRTPQFERWSLEWQRTFGTHTSASVSYFGNHGIHELAQNPNANAFNFGSFPSAFCSSPPVPPCADPRFGEITDLDTTAVSNSNGMIVSLRHRFSGWSSGVVQLNYTYSHTFDEVSNGGLSLFTFGSSIYPQDATNLRGSYGPGDYDVRHSLNGSYVWELPLKTALRGHGADRVVKGWQVSGTIFARTGFPYTVIDFAETGNLAQNNFFGTVYAVPVSQLGPPTRCGKGAAFPPGLQPCQPPQLVTQANGSETPNPNALFVQSGCETGFNSGNLPAPSGPCNGPSVSFAQGRNHFRAPGYFNTDFTIMKNTRLPRWENATLGLGVQFFNFFNHPNFSIPDNGVNDPTFGDILFLDAPPTSIVGSGLGGDAAPRMIQLKAQIQF